MLKLIDRRDRSNTSIDRGAMLQRDLQGVFAAHVARFTDAYYIKGQGEIDVAWLEKKSLQCIEVKWSAQIRPEELKEIRRRSSGWGPGSGSGLIAGRVRRTAAIEGIPLLPAPIVLLRLAARSVVTR